MKFCTRCLYSENHPLNITFDRTGVCSGCRVHEEKDNLDWAERFSKLRSIIEPYRSKSGSSYDCIVPVSGGRDSYFIVHTVKNVCGLNPLLVSYNKQYNTDTGIRNLANLRIQFDCDLLMQTIDPTIVKKLTRATLRRLGSIYWHCIAGQTVFPIHIAVKFKIPLIIWGAHQGVDQVGMFSHLDEVEMTRKYRKEHDLMGLEAEDLIEEFDTVSESDVRQFMYPDDSELEQVGVRGIYLNNYVRWDSKAQHEKMIHKFAYETLPQTRTFDTYNDVDCFNYSDLHDYIKYLKHGYGKATDHACRELRLRRLTRGDAINFARQYTTRAPKNQKLLLEWLGMTENSLQFILDQHRNPKLWRRKDDWQWELTDEIFPSDVANDPEPSLEQIEEICDFQLTASKRAGYLEDKYILVGRGFVE